MCAGSIFSHANPPPPLHALALGFTPEAPVAYEANNFSRNHIKQTRCFIDWKNDIILLLSQTFTSTDKTSKVCVCGCLCWFWGVGASREILFHRKEVLSLWIPHQCLEKQKGIAEAELKHLRLLSVLIFTSVASANSSMHMHARQRLRYGGFCSSIEVSILVYWRDNYISGKASHTLRPS